LYQGAKTTGKTLLELQEYLQHKWKTMP